jgi:uncharacterized protein YkwD
MGLKRASRHADICISTSDYPRMSTRDHMRDFNGRRSHLGSIGVSIAVAVAVSGALVLSVPVQVLANSVRAPARVRLEVGTDAWQVFKATNNSRAGSGLPKLRLNRAMSQVARRHSLAMARAGDLFHTINVSDYLAGVAWNTWGENIGFTPGDVASLQQAFMNSPPHRENILNGAFQQVAIGAVRVDGTLWVTVFLYG